jgi:hypothetical protein
VKCIERDHPADIDDHEERRARLGFRQVAGVALGLARGLEQLVVARAGVLAFGEALGFADEFAGEVGVNEP